MKETFKKLTEEIKAQLAAALATKEVADFLSKTKASEDTGKFRVVVSTADLDRQGEVVDQNGWDLSLYMQNAIVLWAHDYSALPIGVCEKIGLEDIGGGKQGLVAEGKFAPADANPFAQQVRKLYDAGIVRTTSVGFIAKEMQGNTVTKAELLEFSFVPVPANPYALSLAAAKEMGLDMAMLAMKGLKFEEKAEPPKEGDACVLDGGEEGMMQPDGNGALVCMPKPKAAPAADDDAAADEALLTKVGQLMDKNKEDVLAAITAEDASEPEGKGQKEKAGRTLSEKSKAAIVKAIDASKACTVALEELLKTAEPQGEEGEGKSGDGSPLEKRSTPAGQAPTDIIAAFDGWRSNKEALQTIVTVAQKTLERIKAAERGNARK